MKPKPRPATPRRMRLTERDKQLLQAMYNDFGGIVSRRQLALAFFGGNEDWAKKRLRMLYENSYVNQPGASDMHRIPLGQWIYWLDQNGLELVSGLTEDDPRYTDKARTAAPQWAKIEHDLAVNDFRLTVSLALNDHPNLLLGQWITERTLTHWADEVEFTQVNGRSAKKRFAMDAFFTIKYRPPDTERTVLFAYLLEIDKGTHSNPAFVDEKVRPGVVYLTSPIYEARFGVRQGRYLVVTTGGERLENMLRQTGRVAGGEVFYFTTFAAISPETLFTAPIWRSAAHHEPFALIRE